MTSMPARALRPPRSRRAASRDGGGPRRARPGPARRRLDARAPAAYVRGVDEVLVNGTPVVEDGEHTGARARDRHLRAGMTVDLRSDFCAAADGRDVGGDARGASSAGRAPASDANVNELERRGAALLGKEAAVFVPTCSLANLVALLAQGIPGQRRRRARPVRRTSPRHLGAGGLARSPSTPTAAGWIPPWSSARSAARARRCSASRTRTRGAAAPYRRPRGPRRSRPRRAARARIHLDGARLPNAAVALGVPLAALAAPVDTVALSLNKGLCAPFGALLAGDGRARSPRPASRPKRLGGGTMHKAGIFAAAGLVALELVDRLAEDHRRRESSRARSGRAAGDEHRLRRPRPRRCSSARRPRRAGARARTAAHALRHAPPDRRRRRRPRRRSDAVDRPAGALRRSRSPRAVAPGAAARCPTPR